jgi:hypothetical protein
MSLVTPGSRVFMRASDKILTDSFLVVVRGVHCFPHNLMGQAQLGSKHYCLNFSSSYSPTERQEGVKAFCIPICKLGHNTNIATD